MELKGPLELLTSFKPETIIPKQLEDHSSRPSSSAATTQPIPRTLSQEEVVEVTVVETNKGIRQLPYFKKLQESGMSSEAIINALKFLINICCEQWEKARKDGIQSRQVICHPI